MKRIIGKIAGIILVLGLVVPLATAKAGDGEDMIKAASDGYVKYVYTYLQNGTDVNFQDEDGMTALLAASKNGHLGMVETLLINGANVDIKTNSGASALALAKTEKIKEILIAAGATK